MLRGTWFSGRMAVSKTADGSPILSVPAMILEIKKFNDKALREKAKPVEKIDEKIKNLISDMIETMIKSNGIGLAAPQVGVSKRVVVLQTDLDNEQILSLINPKIINKKGGLIQEEGCLSFPEIYINIKRSEEIEVEAMNMKGKKVRFKAQGLLARIIQHEVDHIDGIPFFNRLGLFDKIKFKLKHLSLKF